MIWIEANDVNVFLMGALPYANGPLTWALPYFSNVLKETYFDHIGAPYGIISDLNKLYATLFIKCITFVFLRNLRPCPGYLDWFPTKLPRDAWAHRLPSPNLTLAINNRISHLPAQLTWRVFLILCAFLYGPWNSWAKILSAFPWRTTYLGLQSSHSPTSISVPSSHLKIFTSGTFEQKLSVLSSPIA